MELLKQKEENLQKIYIKYCEDIKQTKSGIREAKKRLKLLKEDRSRILGALGLINEVSQEESEYREVQNIEK